MLHMASLKTPGWNISSPDQSNQRLCRQADSSVSDFLSPGPAYLAPSSNAFWSSSVQLNLHTIQHDRSQADYLLSQYWLNVHPVARVLHRPSFESRWESYWEATYNSLQVPKSLQALVTAVLFSAVVSIPQETITHDLGSSKDMLITDLKAVTEAALSRADWIRSSKIETLQAVVIYLVGVVALILLSSLPSSLSSQKSRE